MRTAQEIERKIASLRALKRAEETKDIEMGEDLDYYAIEMCDATIMALKWALGADDFDI